MSRGPARLSGLMVKAVAILMVCACAGPAAAPRPQEAADAQSSPSRTKSLTVGVTSALSAMGIAGGSSVIGGWIPMTEMHTDGLVTSDINVRQPIGRLAERVPSLDDGSMSLLTDGRMRVAFTLRKGVTWHDGTPFTAQDLVFTYQLGTNLPKGESDPITLMSSVEAPDPSTFVIYYKQAYRLGALLGPLMYWPLPEHLLGSGYAALATSKNQDDLFRDPYWTSGYVNTGAFRLTRFEPGVGMDFQAYDGYFLGRPKIDAIHIKIFNDDSVLLSSILGGAVDLTPELALRQSAGVPLRDAWKSNGEGTVYVSDNAMRLLSPQMRPPIQIEPAVLDPRVRTALLHALDIEALSDAVNGGNPQLAAWSLLSKADPLYQVTKDTLRPFNYNPDRAKALLGEVGWTPGTDGALRNETDGRLFRTVIWASLGTDEEIGAYADYWRKIGLQVEEHAITAVESRDNSVRAQFPSWDIASVDAFSTMANRASSAETRWIGNRNGYEDPQARRLSAAFQTSLTQNERAQAMRALNEFFISQMVALPTFYQAAWIAERKRIKAFGDFDGGWGAHIGVNGYWGSYYRDAYLWDSE
ncbi:MAG TPA: ABC transporter substrate-binding protein [Chloroflexota bacterium]